MLKKEKPLEITYYLHFYADVARIVEYANGFHRKGMRLPRYVRLHKEIGELGSVVKT